MLNLFVTKWQKLYFTTFFWHHPFLYHVQLLLSKKIKFSGLFWTEYWKEGLAAGKSKASKLQAMIWCASMSSPMPSSEKQKVTYGIGQFLCWKYSHHDQFQTIECEVTEHQVGKRYTVAYHNTVWLPFRYNQLTSVA